MGKRVLGNPEIQIPKFEVEGGGGVRGGSSEINIGIFFLLGEF